MPYRARLCQIRTVPAAGFIPLHRVSQTKHGFFERDMGHKLSRNELKRITTVAKSIRQKSGVKSVERVTKYNMKWQTAIKQAAKQVLADRRVKQKRVR